MSRLWRTLRELSPAQVARRARLRTRAAIARAAPGIAARAADRRAGPPPPRRPIPPPPTTLLRPCDPAFVEDRAAAVAAGRFTFLGETRDLGGAPFPAPADAPLLWAYHLEYLDLVPDLVRTGRVDAARTLVGARLAAEGRGGPGASHPYTDSRRTTALVHAMLIAGEGAPPEFARGAWRWANRVAANVELDVGGNHLLENGLALALAGAAFRGPVATRMLERGARILAEGTRRQILPDGAHYELSPLYHARVLFVLAEGGRVLEAAGRPPGSAYWDAVGRATAFLAGLVDPDGQLPLFGDTSREEDLEPETLLDAAADLLPGPPPPVPRGDRLHADSGFAVLLGGAPGDRLVLDAGPVCPDDLPAHGQADTFTFELHAAGRPIVVDAGVYEYAGPMRAWCRGTRAHNTVEVAGRDSSEVWGSFRVGRRARIAGRRFEASRDAAGVVATHDGYRDLGVLHTRRAARLAPRLFLIADALAGRTEHSYICRIHLHPEVILERPDERTVMAHLAGATVRIGAFGPVRAAIGEGWHCPRFGEKHRCPVVELSGRGTPAAFGAVLTLDGRPAEVRLEGGGVTVLHDGRTHRRDFR